MSFIGPRPNLLSVDVTEPQVRLEASQPILSIEDMEKIRTISDYTNNQFRSTMLTLCYDVALGADGMEDALTNLCRNAEARVREGFNILILSDRDSSATRIAIPGLLATAAVHHHLVKHGLRTTTGLVVETGSARETHHFALLAGYGAEAIHPYLVFETIATMGDLLPSDLAVKDAHKRYIKSVSKGLLKVMSKMGISTYQSYCGAQIFEAVGLSSAFLKKYFKLSFRRLFDHLIVGEVLVKQRVPRRTLTRGAYFVISNFQFHASACLFHI